MRKAAPYLRLRRKHEARRGQFQRGAVPGPSWVALARAAVRVLVGSRGGGHAFERPDAPRVASLHDRAGATPPSCLDARLCDKWRVMCSEDATKMRAAMAPSVDDGPWLGADQGAASSRGRLCGVRRWRRRRKQEDPDAHVLAVGAASEWFGRRARRASAKGSNGTDGEDGVAKRERPWRAPRASRHRPRVR